MGRGDLGARRREVSKAVQRFQAQAGGTGQGAGVRVTFNDDGPGDLRGLSRVFVGLGATLDAAPEILRTAGVPAIRAGFAANFQRQAERKPWAALAPSTVEERLRLGFGRGPILQRTGALRSHVLTAPAKITGGSGGGVTLTIRPGNSVRGVPKYEPLARGTSRMPARPMVVLTGPAATKVTSAISRAFRQRAAANGLG